MSILPLSFPDWALADAECLLLRRLRETPRVFVDLQECVGSELHIQKELRRQYPDDLVRAALTLSELRRKGSSKFPEADRMWFDRQGLEQATHQEIARHKAKRFSGRVWDLCCGIGSDAGALSRVAEVIAVDQQPTAALRTLWNAEVLGCPERLSVRVGDAREMPIDGELLHIDPDRRPQGTRVPKIEDYAPNLDELRVLMARSRGGAIKVSPASNFAGKFPDTEAELISWEGECKEATLWFGELAGSALFRATVLPAGETLSGHPLQAVAPRSPVGRYLFDPDPAVVRAGLVDLLAEQLGISRTDDAEEYLTASEAILSPFVQTFEVLEVLPNQERAIRQALRAHRFGTTEIKCRHIPVNAQELSRRLPKDGNEPGVLLFVREQGKAKAVLARRMSTRQKGDEACL